MGRLALQNQYGSINRVDDEFQDIETRRTMTIARFINSPDGSGGERLLDARIIWMNEDGRFTLAGVERVKIDGDEVEVLQSWLVFPDGNIPPMPEGVIFRARDSRRGDKRQRGNQRLNYLKFFTTASDPMFNQPNSR